MGGNCKGRRFVFLHWEENQWYDCQHCLAYELDPDEGHQCQVLNGQEEPWFCEGLLQILHFEEVPVPKFFGIKSWP